MELLETDTDGDALHQGYIAITPIHLDLTHHAFIEELDRWELWHDKQLAL